MGDSDSNSDGGEWVEQRRHGGSMDDVWRHMEHAVLVVPERKDSWHSTAACLLREGGTWSYETRNSEGAEAAEQEE